MSSGFHLLKKQRNDFVPLCKCAYSWAYLDSSIDDAR